MTIVRGVPQGVIVNDRAVDATNPLPVTGDITGVITGEITANVAASENHIGAVGGNMTRVTASIVRPADTTAYTNGDVISSATTDVTPKWTFPVARVNGGSGYIVSATVWTDQKACVGVLRLKLHNLGTVTVAGDNAANTTLYANAGAYIDSIDFPALAEGTDTTNSTGAKATNDSLRVPFVCDASSSNLYGTLEVVSAAFTPASGQQFTIVLVCDLN